MIIRLPSARRGWQRDPAAPIFGRMTLLRHLSPLRAWHDLRSLVTTRRPHQWGFMGVALAMTYVVVMGILYQSRIPPKPYHRDIVYVQQWRADRSDAEIVAQQKVDGVAQTRRESELKRLEAERRAQFKKVGDAMKAYGL